MKYLLSIMTVCVFSIGCSGLLDVPVPDNKTIGKQVFSNKDSAVAAVMGIYAGLSSTNNLLSGATSVYAGVYSDELTYMAQQSQVVEFYSVNISSANTTVEAYFWATAYKYIYAANACIEGIEDSKALTADFKNQLIGECKVLRALLYFHLIRCFGDVPLVKVTSYLENEQMPRTSKTTVEKFIEAELQAAKAMLAVAYASANRARVNKWTATAVLAAYYLYKQEWTLAERHASDVIDAGYYSLEELNKVFLSTSKEAIFQLQPVLTGYNTMEGNWLIPSGTARPNFPLTPSLIKAFEPGDKRRAEWVSSKIVNNAVYEYPFKYKKRVDFSANFSLTEFTMLLRLSEMYLIRAEARVMLGQLPGSINDLDMIRRRAGLLSIAEQHPGISSNELIEKIHHERRVELFVECGHRWYDLKRTGKVSEVMRPLKAGWQETDTLWPIPSSQIFLNPVLTQNPGYQ